jgi:hypothetical protein
MSPALSWSAFVKRSLFALALAGSGFIGTASAADPAAELPLKKVVLFNSGVGYYEHHGSVDGDKSIDLKFNVEDVNDLLKSLVPQDLDGGKVSTVTYSSRDPITKTLQTFTVDLTRNPTLAQLLDQVRGEKAEIETSKTITGTILGVEKRKRAVKDEVLEEEFLNLLTDAGLTSVPLAGVQRIKLTNEKLDAELRQALAVLALAHQNDKKTVSLRFNGEGKRRVQVGYVQNAPIWKTSYRLVLSDDAPLLQGWAIVENTTEEDWKDVNLSMVSGRPISFVMDLYQPLYVGRPTVEPELFASLRPQTYGQDMNSRNAEFARKADALKETELDGLAMGRRQISNGYANAAPGAPPPAPMAKAAAAPYEMQNRGRDRAAAWGDEKRSIGIVASAATATDVGEMFQYNIEAPVTLARQKSAMLPIVGEKVKGDKVSIYNPSVHAKHPLNGLRLTNSTKLHLMQGPITVYDDGAYAGDAQIENLAPGTERLISYAMDLDTEVAQAQTQKPSQLTSVKIVKGVLYANNKLEREQTYTAKNSGKKTKSVLIEYPLDASWKLVTPEKPEEKTRDRYRFLVKAEPGKPAELKVKEEQQLSSQFLLTNMDSNQILIYSRAQVTSEAQKKALEEVRTRQLKLSDLRQQLQRLEQQVRIIDQEQARIRQNMNQLDRNSELYQRYVKKFTEQEDGVEKLRMEIKDLEAKIDADMKSLNEYLANLSVD